jgi:predicted nucleic acid-binding protein
VIVLDASALVDVLIASARAPAIVFEMEAADSLHAPHLIDVEVLHAIRSLTQRGAMTPASARTALDASDLILPLMRHPHRRLWRRTWELRDRFSAYDATYVTLAEVLDAPLLTADARLARGASGLVDVILAA